MKQFFNNLNKIIATFFFLWQKVINKIYKYENEIYNFILMKYLIIGYKY